MLLTRKHLVLGFVLLLAFTSTSAAAATLAANSVRSAQIKNGQVKTVDLANGGVTTAKVKDGTLKATDFAGGALPAGPQGPAGPEGPQGPPGPEGPVNADQIEDVPRSIQVPLTSFVVCPEGVGGIAPVDFVSGDDTFADLSTLNPAESQSGQVIEFDVDAQPDTTAICSTVQVPVDWASGAVVFVRIFKGTGTGQTERLLCPIRLNGLADDPQDTPVNIGSQGLHQCPNEITGAGLGGSTLVLRLAIADADQAVRVQSVAVRYLATS